MSRKSFLYCYQYEKITFTSFAKKKKKLCKELQQSDLNCIDFSHICSLFLNGNDKDVQENKFNKLLNECQLMQDLKRVVFSYSNISLSGTEIFISERWSFPFHQRNLII